MLKTIQKLTFTISIVLLAYLSYLGFFHDSARAWQNFQKPQMAAFTTLEEDEQILEELKNQIRFNGAKAPNPELLSKTSIFNKIER